MTQGVQDAPLRSYLDQTVVPPMLEALTVLARDRPEKPIEFLADYLEEHNAERSAGGADNL